MKRLLGASVFIIVFSLNAFVFFHRKVTKELPDLQLRELQEDDRLFKSAMRAKKNCCFESTQRNLSSDLAAAVYWSPQEEKRFVEEAGILTLNDNLLVQDEEIGNSELQEIRLEAGSAIRVIGRVSFRAKKINIMGIIDGDFPVYLEKTSYRAEENYLEFIAEEELNVSGIVFLRHYFKNLDHEVDVLPSYAVNALEKTYRLKLSAQKISIKGLLSLSQFDLKPFNAHVLVNVVDAQNSYVSASSFDQAEQVDFNPTVAKTRSAAR